MRDRFNTLIIGAKRSGKSYFAEKLAQKYALHYPVIVYNCGRPDNFRTAETIHDIENFEGKKGQFMKMPLTKSETNTDFEYLSTLKNYLLIVDDCSFITDRGKIGEGLYKILSIPDHIGIDICLIYHCANLVPRKAYYFATHLVQFKTMAQPSRRRKDDTPNFETVADNFKVLEKAPSFYHYQANFLKGTNQLYKPI